MTKKSYNIFDPKDRKAWIRQGENVKTESEITSAERSRINRRNSFIWTHAPAMLAGLLARNTDLETPALEATTQAARLFDWLEHDHPIRG